MEGPLRLTAWRAEPAVPSTAPTSSTAAILGSREAMTTDVSAGSARPVNAFQTWGADFGRALGDVDDREAGDEQEQGGRHRGRARPGRGRGDGRVAGIVAVTAMCYFASAFTIAST
ncbi:hypothetical protein GCM10010390_35870 [Streptomyces mordarskii]|uniref:Uncharacterized protein n=1 Tax=Streptomyces mordarskii TaxID=1226758 RepID=A0ABP3MXY1_9ACTN